MDNLDRLTFIKFGGSVITNKREQETPDTGVIRGLAEELHTFRAAHPDHPLLLGHGSGSFGHSYAARYGIHRGLQPGDDWIGFALTGGAALRLNRIVVDTLLAAGVPALSFQPSASLQSSSGQISAWNTTPIVQALTHRLVPVIHGDVAFDTARGSAIVSTETLFDYLALHTTLRPSRIILVGEKAVYTADPRLDSSAQPVPRITSANIEETLCQASGAHAIDVTGGMRSKIETMWKLVQALPHLTIYLIGTAPGLLEQALRGETVPEGTMIHR